MAIYGLFFGRGDPKMVSYERPRPDGRFDVWHAHTQGNFTVFPLIKLHLCETS